MGGEIDDIEKVSFRQSEEYCRKDNDTAGQ
jgi:hypothetical protein